MLLSGVMDVHKFGVFAWFGKGEIAYLELYRDLKRGGWVDRV